MGSCAKQAFLHTSIPNLYCPVCKYVHFAHGIYLEIFLFLVVEGDEDGKHRGEGPEGGASVAHEW